MKKSTILKFWIFVLIIATLFFVFRELGKYDESNGIANIPQIFYTVQPVERIGVLEADEFDLSLSAGSYKRIHAKLTVKAVPEAKTEVIKFLNNCTDPRVKMLRVEDGVWEIVLYITPTGKSETTLSKWLEDKNLIWQ